MRDVVETFSRVSRKAPVVALGTLVGSDMTTEVIGNGESAGREALFEIGSVTKTVTALLLAQMCGTGEVGLTDPLSRFFPEARSDSIRLVDLATHTARLPGIPRDLLIEAIRNRSDPYARYGDDRLRAAVSRIRPRDGVGQKFKYSNFGFALLGRALERAAGVRYEQLVIDRICLPLGLKDTVAVVPADDTARFVPGHKRVGKPVANWDLASFAPAGVLKSTVVDMLKYVRAHLHPEGSSLEASLREVQRLRVHIRKDRFGIGLGWLVVRRKGRTYLWHNGGTGGFSSFVGFCPDGDYGLVALANARVSGPLTRLGTRWLEQGPR